MRMRERVVEIGGKACAEALAETECAGVIVGITNTTVSCQCTILRMEEDVPIQALFHNVLRISPIVPIEVQRHRIDSLRRSQVVSWENVTAKLEVVLVHQEGDV